MIINDKYNGKYNLYRCRINKRKTKRKAMQMMKRTSLQYTALPKLNPNLNKHTISNPICLTGHASPCKIFKFTATTNQIAQIDTCDAFKLTRSWIRCIINASTSSSTIKSAWGMFGTKLTTAGSTLAKYACGNESQWWTLINYNRI